MGKFDFTEIRFFPAAKSGLPSRFDFSCARSAQIPAELENMIPRPEEKKDIFTTTPIFNN